MPGVLTRMAEIPPAKMAAFQRPISMANPSAGSNQKVMGVMMAIPMVADRPGSAPMAVPIITPRARNKITEGCKHCCNAAIKISADIQAHLLYILNWTLNPTTKARYRKTVKTTV